MSRAGRLESVGWWSHGRRAGTWWTAVPGGAWLVTNTNTTTAIFLYPDLVTALLGNINTQDWTAEEELAVCEVSSLSVEAGVLVPGLTKSEGTIPANKGGDHITSGGSQTENVLCRFDQVSAGPAQHPRSVRE